MKITSEMEVIFIRQEKLRFLGLKAELKVIKSCKLGEN